MSLVGGWAAFILVVLLPVSAGASPPSTCFAELEPARVLPDHAAQWSAQGPFSVLAGARVFFRAKPGLTREWLHHRMSLRLAQQAAGGNCPLDVPGTSIRVSSASAGFWLHIGARESGSAREVLQRSRAVVD